MKIFKRQKFNKSYIGDAQRDLKKYGKEDKGRYIQYIAHCIYGFGNSPLITIEEYRLRSNEKD